jgi:hypothetical protein
VNSLHGGAGGLHRHNGDKHLGAAAVEVDPIRKLGGAMGYFAKYLGKGDQTIPGNFSGRYWGKVNAKRLPVAASKELEVPQKMAAMIRRIARKKMASDVNTSCWRRWLDRMWKSSFRFSRLQWERAKSQFHGGVQRIAVWFHLPAERLLHEGEWLQSSAMDIRVKYDRDQFRHILHDHPLPKRWRPRHNDRVRLLCDASKFIEQLARLHTPAGSFLRFSRADLSRFAA